MLSRIILVIVLFLTLTVSLSSQPTHNTNSLSTDALRALATVLSNHSIISNQLNLYKIKAGEQSNIIVIQSNLLLYYEQHYKPSSFLDITLTFIPFVNLIILLLHAL